MSKRTLHALIVNCFLISALYASGLNAQQIKSVRDASIKIKLENADLMHVFHDIEAKTDYEFSYKSEDLDQNFRFTGKFNKASVADVLLEISKQTGLKFRQVNNNIHISKKSEKVPDEQILEIIIQGITITGKVISIEDEEGLPGVNVILKGTSQGTVTDVEGKYSIDVPDANSILVYSSVGFVMQEIAVGNQAIIDLVMTADITALDELVVIGYGTQKKADITGSVIRADIDAFLEQPNVSLLQSLQGSVPGLYVGQVNAAGEDPIIRIRERTSLEGEQQPLIILDGVIYRGNLIDINPNDIGSVDVLKDASSTAIYGSQAANGVIIISSKTGKTQGKTSINYRTSFTTQSPTKEFRAQGVEGWVNQYYNGKIIDARIAPDYLQIDPSFDPTALFKTEGMVEAFNAGQSTDWYDLLTNDHGSIVSHNVSLSHSNNNVSTFMSVGYTDQVGYHVGEDYTRWNARINLDNYVTDWLTIGVQSFVTSSDYSGLDISRDLRYLTPVGLARDEDGELTVQPNGLSTNPLRDIEEADHVDTRLNLFGNIYALIEFPFLKGLTYKVNYSTNYRSEYEAIFRPYGANFQGSGEKTVSSRRSWTSDNILSYSNSFGDHNISATAVFGFEERNGNGTGISSEGFVSDALGFNNLSVGSIILSNGEFAYEEASLYNLGRLTYGYKGKYLFTGSIRRDGFSGFGENEKFGTFPSVALAWVASEEAFLDAVSWISSLKLRGSYGSSGNRTVGRYDTQARVSGGFGYVDADGNSLFTQSISSLENPNLKWETTTGINIGVDFSVLDNRITGTIDYYNNNTEDILFDVPIPRITRFEDAAVNLGKLGNNGIDIGISSVNVKNEDITWTSTVIFSRSRHQLKELLGFDNDGDGVEDDIIGSDLFIGEPIGTIYELQIDRIYQIGDDIPSGFDFGVFRIVDTDGVDGITPDDRTILGNDSPNYRFSILNRLSYKNWSLMVFFNSIQGGKNSYLGVDALTNWITVSGGDSVYDRVLFEGADYWTPENPDAKYQRVQANVTSSGRGVRYTSRSFVRLQDVSLSYNIDKSFLDKIGISRLNVFLSGKNLATWTKWPGWDPETGTGLTRSGRPVMKSYSIGLNLEF